MVDLIRSEFPLSSDRLAILPIRHNWSSSLTFSIEFKTDIIRSANGKEQRRAVRNTARFSQTMSMVMSWEERLAFEDAMTRRQVEGFYVPLEFCPMYMQEALAPTEHQANYTCNALPDDELPPFWLAVGDEVILADRQRPWVREVRTVSVLTDHQVTFGQESEGEFTRQSYIWPAYPARLDMQPGMDLRTSTVGEATSFTVLFRPANLNTLPIVGTPYFLGVSEFFNFKPNWTGVAETFIWDHYRIDYSYGRIANIHQVNSPGRAYKMEFLFFNIRQAFELMGFFQRMRGMLQHFFFSTWTDDINVSAVANGGSSLIVEGQRLGATYHDSAVFRRIMIRYNDDTVSHHKVLNVNELPETESSVVRLDDDFPEDRSLEDIAGVSWVLNGRFATDRLDCEFITASVGRISLSFQSMENAEL